MSGHLRWYVPTILLVFIIISKAHQRPSPRFTRSLKQYCDAELRTMLALTCEINMSSRRKLALKGLPPRYKKLTGIPLLKKESKDLIEKADEACCRKLCSIEEMSRFCPHLNLKHKLNYDLFFNINYHDL